VLLLWSYFCKVEHINEGRKIQHIYLYKLDGKYHVFKLSFLPWKHNHIFLVRRSTSISIGEYSYIFLRINIHWQ
jgi:hypothetical protein